MSPLSKKRLKRGAFIGLSLAPSLVIILAFYYFSIFYCFGVSFFKWNMLGAPKFIGLNNYVLMFTNPDFWNSVKVSFVYAFWAVPFCIVLGLLAGLLLKNATFGKSFFRVMLFLPVVISMVVAALIWKWILNAQAGILNYILISVSFAKLGDMPHWMRWVNDPLGGSMAAILFVGIWKRVGYNAVIFLAGLENIPLEYYEAATLDGANPWQKFWGITLPLLAPVLFFVTVIQIIAALKVSISPLVMTQGGPARSTDVFVLHIYKEAFQNFRMGYASAIAVAVFLLILVFTVLQFRVGEKKVHYQ
ncbi:MAG: sugar ABC transporter permease [Treponemataceae bacterium]